MKLIRASAKIHTYACGKSFPTAYFRCLRCGSTTHRPRAPGIKAETCGCRVVNRTHGLTRHPLFKRWQSMLSRCGDPNSPSYRDYGGRGIDVCREWKESFPSFFAWAGASGWSKELQLDRIDNSAGYSPDNCRFVTRQVNCRNRRTTRFTMQVLVGVWFDRKLGLGRRELEVKYNLNGAQLFSLLKSTRIMKTVTFVISDGKVEIEAAGFTGGACDAATKAFEEVLGGNVENKKRKAEYHKVAPVTLKQGAK